MPPIKRQDGITVNLGTRNIRWQRKLSKLIPLGLSFPIDKVSMLNIITVFILPGSTFYPFPREIPWKRKWQPTPVFLPGKSHGQRGVAGYSLWGHKESDTTE